MFNFEILKSMSFVSVFLNSLGDLQQNGNKNYHNH
jgi:hypothetical protein